MPLQGPITAQYNVQQFEFTIDAFTSLSYKDVPRKARFIYKNVEELACKAFTGSYKPLVIYYNDFDWKYMARDIETRKCFETCNFLDGSHLTCPRWWVPSIFNSIYQTIVPHTSCTAYLRPFNLSASNMWLWIYLSSYLVMGFTCWGFLMSDRGGEKLIMRIEKIEREVSKDF